MEELIGIIGHFGADKNFYDGQTVKTKTLCDALIKYGNYRLLCVDTYYNKTDRIKLITDSVKCIARCKKIIILLSGNGMRVYFPFMYYANRLFHRKIYHDVIGGNLDQYIKKNPKWKKYLSAFEVNWVELYMIKKALLEAGLDNIEIIPNFKALRIPDAVEKKQSTSVIRFCTFSRVAKEKGVTDAICAVRNINNQLGKCVASLDIWGQIDDKYRDEFYSLIKDNNCITYKGISEFNSSINVLKQYDALLFPTYWDGEGFPGTIIDAFASGLPVIATDWHGNAEIIEDGRTGIIYPNKTMLNLNDAILWSLDNRDTLETMRQACLKEAEKYTAEHCIRGILKKLKD